MAMDRYDSMSLVPFSSISLVGLFRCMFSESILFYANLVFVASVITLKL